MTNFGARGLVTKLRQGGGDKFRGQGPGDKTAAGEW